MTGIPTMSPYACATARLKLARAVAAVKPTPLSAKIGGLIRTSYLTTVTGAEKHILSVASHQGIQALLVHPGRVTADYLWALAQSAKSHVRGENLPPSAFRQVGSALDSEGAKLIWNAFAKGSKEAWQAIKSGVDPEVVGDAFHVQKVQYGNPILQSAVDHVNAFVTARNKPFYEMAIQGSLYVQAKALAIREGLTGVAQVARVNALLAKPTDEMAAVALQFADKEAFSNVGPATKLFEGARRGLEGVRDQPMTRGPVERAKIQATMEGLTGDAAAQRRHQLLALSPAEFEQAVKVPREVTGAPAQAKRAMSAAAGAGLVGMDIVAPFPRIGFNLAARSIDYTPAGAVKALASSLLAKDPAILREGLIKSGVGSAVGYTVGYYLASQGRMTGADDKHHPNSIKIGNTWHNFSVFLPVGIMPLLGANFYEQQDKHPESLLRNAVAATKGQLSVLTEESVLYSMQHLGDTFAAGSSPSQMARGIGAFLPVPPVIGQLTKATDPYVRNTSDPNVIAALVKQQLAKTPGASFLLPPRLSKTGQPITRPEGALGAFLDPTQPQSDQQVAKAKPTRQRFGRFPNPYRR